ncbi:fatty-acyl-CoA synthase [Amycolatopsis arida]|uniref:Fatty-acyl-CoA synthase n=1 Tax=Amycolatopsis arida TaxID=587909 RepID=A0A1I5XMF1_9PSEU|nr:long-chain-fatty-acid--CoA ligase [Amycolatopsis arida]TDX97370.1 fatty-acyl-CoA synthase [Amycolatopsis arida]SFQ32897.1 fatty-acyl-CoA synthase [Amycolatopsis arida]
MSAPATPPTVTELLLARRDDTHTGLRWVDTDADRAWSWAEHVQGCAEHAAAVRALLPAGGPPHVGLLADNVPESSFLLGGAAFGGTVLVGLNPTRRGTALARDVRLADCRLVLADPAYAPLLAGLDLGGARVLALDGPEWTGALAAHRGAPVEPVAARPDDLLMLIFTSGTSGDPKAVRCTHAKVAFPGHMLAERFGLSTRDVVYVAMPMFHSNAVMAGWSVGLAAGATIALRRRFSASAFLADVRRVGATYANYVGTPLSYVLATPPGPDDADNPLRLVYGNEGAEADLTAFAERFGCHVVDAFGSTEGGVGFARTPDTPPGSLGRLVDGVAVVHPETGRPCPPAEFGPDGTLRNAEEAVGELVNTTGPGWFAGYYGDPAAEAERLRDGRYHTGDLAYLDADGFCYFAGRLGDWLRVGGENLGTAPIERVLLRHPAVAEAAVYGVPDPSGIGDAVMVALVLDGPLPPEAFGEFLAAQRDLGPRQWPRYVRIATELPRTPTYKVRKRALAAEGTGCADPVWHRAGPEPVYAPLVSATGGAG